METYRIFGLMSGTSLDGLDIACCDFWEDKKGKWNYRVLATETVAYPKPLGDKLKNCTSLNAIELCFLDKELGEYFGKKVKEFKLKHTIAPLLVASHGHTVFHQPEKGLTLQIGDGHELMVHSESTVINDFRSLDVALGGQGAPLVPIGDKLLFEAYDFCINLGGIANISWDDEQRNRRAFDICACNMVLNLLANREKRHFDDRGRLAREGKLSLELLEKLNDLVYYKMEAPKSLGVEWFREHIIPLLNNEKLNTKDYLRSFSEHIAIQISQVLNELSTKNKKKETKVLFTGGGTFNNFLIERIRNYTKESILFEIPEKETINFKEAVIFAFLGLLRHLGFNNVLSSVTNARVDSSGGTIYSHERIMKK